jgi:hypothetical protein
MEACMLTLLEDNGHMQTSNMHGMKTNLNCGHYNLTHHKNEWWSCKILKACQKTKKKKNKTKGAKWTGQNLDANWTCT